ncbi:Bgt-2769, partial [Blumeria graminis f. sp. tritici]
VSFRRENARLAAHNRFLNTETGIQNEIRQLNYSPTKSTSIRSNLNPKTLSLQHAPSISQGIQLLSPQNLPDKLRHVFPFKLFNAIQSKCFGPIFDTNDNIIVSAPTGSGKTVLLELAICKLVEKYPSGQFKIIYQAPTKSLCSERLRDWQKKFNHLNLPCAELTSDTSQSDMIRVRNASIIVTTPEKWDSITRKWSDHHKLVQMVKLFLIDEVHILKDVRGATLEAVVSRMKIMGANVRFVALSATVPNSEDIAVWLGRDHTNQHLPAHRETFGEEFRPVKLQKHVHAFDGTFNDYAFDKFLDGKLTSLLQKYTQKKPIMVFCFTRKSCEGTASILSEWWARQRISDRPWLAPRQKVCIGCKELQSVVSCGVAFHHAGLDAQDRYAIETGYLKGDISVICCTSTLAVGVNLPCHMVILKGTVGFQDGVLREYSDLEVMQMLGRAGRPQFDDSAIAIIITRTGKSERYKKMIAGQDILESTLHLNLIEHLNSEISLGSVKDLSQAKIWITRTFLSVRMRQNPMFYQISGVTDRCDTDERLEKVCERDINLLKEYLLVRGEERLTCTEYGEAMCRYMVQFETMKLLVSIPKQANKEQILSTLCRAVEFKDLRIKPAERSCLRQLNKSPLIKFPVSEPISTIAQKVSIIIQVHLGGIPYPDEKEFGPVRRQFSTDKNIIFERAQRLIRCVIDCKAFDLDSVSARHALELFRSLCAENWENSNLQLRQVPQIGPVAHRKLTEANINTVYELAQQDAASIERIVSKNPPFGIKMKDTLASFPRLKIFVEIINKNYHIEVKKTLIYVRASISYENKEPPIWLNRKPNVVFMAETSDGKGFDIRFTVDLSTWKEIKCWVACEEIVGTLRSTVISYDMLGPNFLKPSGRNGSNIEKSKISEFDQDEFDDDDLGDEDMLAIINGVENSDNNHYNSDEFMDIDNLELKNKSSPLLTKSSTINRMKPIIESTRMYNGRWTCQHDCRDRGVRKDGKLCKHKCCHEGTDKPSRLKRMVGHVFFNHIKSWLTKCLELIEQNGCS